MKLKSLLLATLFATGLTTAQAAEGELSIGTEGAYPPWSMADAVGNVTGFDADVGNLRAGLRRPHSGAEGQAF